MALDDNNVPEPEGVGCVFVPVFILITAVIIWSLGCRPADAATCVQYGPVCVSPYLVKYLPPKPAPDASTGNVVALVATYWPDHLEGWALRIIECESGGDTRAYNPRSGAAGLFQFLESTWNRGPAPALGLPSYDSGAVYNAEWNIQAAAWLYENWGGRSQWSCKA